MKNTKRCFAFFSFYDCTEIEEFLEKQAEKGWMLDKSSSFGWHFHRIEPRKMHFSVVYFAKASVFDPEPSKAQLVFHDFCEHTGWKLAASNAQMQIFYNEAPNPTPIETDATLKVSAIHASAKKSHLSSYYLLAGMGILQASLFFWRFFSDPIGILANNVNLFFCMCWMLMLATSVVDIVGYHIWYKRAKSAAKLDGSFVETKGHRNFRIVMLCMMLLAFAFIPISYGRSKMTLIVLVSVVVVLSVTAIIVCTSKLMKKMKLLAKINRNITIILTLIISYVFVGILSISVISRVISFLPEKVTAGTYELHGHTFKVYCDELPLTIEDLIETDYDGYSYEIRTLDKSVFIEHKEAAQLPRMDALVHPKLDYSITTVKMPFMYEFCKKALLDDFVHDYGHPEPEDDMWEEHIKIDATPWGANEAYQLKLGGEMYMRFLLCYDNCIVEIEFERDWQLTSEQMKIVAEKLGK